MDRLRHNQRLRKREIRSFYVTRQPALPAAGQIEGIPTSTLHGLNGLFNLALLCGVLSWQTFGLVCSDL